MCIRDRYKSLVRFGELEERADEVNDTAYELLYDCLLYTSQRASSLQEVQTAVMKRIHHHTRKSCLSWEYRCLASAMVHSLSLIHISFGVSDEAAQHERCVYGARYAYGADESPAYREAECADI